MMCKCFCDGGGVLLMVFLCQVLVLSCSVSAVSYVKVRNGGYERVTVAVDENIEAEKCDSIVQGLKDLFNLGSVALTTATDDLLFFREVAILLPEACSGYEPKATLYVTPADADIRVERSSSFHPYTVQPGQCATPGRYIVLPEDFVLKDNDKKGKIFLREWSRLRYGVYNESWTPDNPQFPPAYVDENANILPTSCTDLPLQVTFDSSQCNVTNIDKCTWSVRDEDNAGVTSSLMYTADLQGVTHFCTDSTHIKQAPTRHNLLCNERSVWDVISSHQDFSGNPPTDITGNVNIVFLRKPAPQLYFVLDAFLVQKNSMEIFRKSLGMIIDQSKGFVFNLIVCQGNSITQPTPCITSSPGCPRYIDFYIQNITSSVELCNLTEAFQRIVQSMNDQVYPVLYVTSAPSMVNQWSRWDAVIETIALPFNILALGQQTSPDFIKLTRYGELYSIGEDGSNYATLKLGILNVLRKLLNIVESRHLSQELNHEICEEKEKGVLTIGNTEEYILFLMPGEGTEFSLDATNVHCEGEIGPDGNMINSTCLFEGTWEYTVERTTVDSNCSRLVLWTEGSVDAPDVRTWTSATTSGVKDTELLIYAEIIARNESVEVSEVRAHVALPCQDSEEIVDLVDSGYGVPDVTKGDGVYSAYLTRFCEIDGIYSYWVEVVMRKAQIGSKYLQADGIYHVIGPSFHVSGVPSGQDVLPPARILDLQAKIGDSTECEEMAYCNFTIPVTLTWAATGDNYTVGRASSYQLKCDTTRPPVKNCLVGGLLTAPAIYGAPEKMTVFLPLQNAPTTYFITVVAVDSAGMRSNVSNIASLYVGNSTNTGPSDTCDERKLMYIIVAATVGVVILLLVFFGVCILLRKPKGSRRQPLTDNDNGNFPEDQDRLPRGAAWNEYAGPPEDQISRLTNLSDQSLPRTSVESTIDRDPVARAMVPRQPPRRVPAQENWGRLSTIGNASVYDIQTSGDDSKDSSDYRAPTDYMQQEANATAEEPKYAVPIKSDNVQDAAPRQTSKDWRGRPTDNTTSSSLQWLKDQVRALPRNPEHPKPRVMSTFQAGHRRPQMRPPAPPRRLQIVNGRGVPQQEDSEDSESIFLVSTNDGAKWKQVPVHPVSEI